MPGAPMHTWYCSVFLRWKRTPAGGVFTSGGRTRGPFDCVAFRCAASSSRISRSCCRLPAAAMTMFPGVYIVRW